MSMKDLKDLVEKIDEKVDKLDGRLDSIDVTLAKQNKELEHHIYRTSLNEEQLAILRAELKPIQKHVTQVSTGFKIIGMAMTGLGLVVGAIKVVLALF